MSTNLGLLELQQFDFVSSPPRIRRIEQSASTMTTTTTMECPRCGSINTKFCYYNNYSKTQPRYFCKACKRHWTKGGTLRNVPTGGAARKNNKRQKKINKAASPVAAATHIVTETQIPNHDDPLPRVSEFSYQSTPLLDNLGSFVSFGNLMDATGLLDLSQQQFSFSSLSSFENNNPISSLSTTSTSADTYSYAEMINATSTSTAAAVPQPWPNCWNLEDIDTLVSSHELNIPNWDESPLV